MEIVIKISEDAYNLLKQKYRNGKADVLDCIILNGNILPKEHGRLIDEQQIIDRFRPIERFKHWYVGTDGLFNVLSDAPTIIEAEGE